MTEWEKGARNAEDPIAVRGEGARNAAADPEWVERQNRLMVEEAAKMRERIKRHAIYTIQGQPFFGEAV